MELSMPRNTCPHLSTSALLDLYLDLSRGHLAAYHQSQAMEL